MTTFGAGRSFPDLYDTLEWNPVIKETITATQLPDGNYRPLPDRTLFMESSVLMIGARNPEAGPNWFLACRAFQLLSFLPSSTSQFVAAVQAEQRIVRLDTLNLIVFPKLAPQWLLQLRFPIWHKQMYIEVWSYSGQDLDTFSELARIEGKIDGLSTP